MNKLKTLLVSVIVGSVVAAVAIAFTGPGASTPGVSNPDFWIKNGNDVYYNPAVSGNVGIELSVPRTSSMSRAVKSTPPAVCVSPAIVKPRGALITGLFPAPICIPIRPVII